MKGNDFGKAIGIDRPANVKDKIKKWQQELDTSPDPAENPPATPNARPPEEGSSSSPQPAGTSTPAPAPKPKPTPTPAATATATATPAPAPTPAPASSTPAADTLPERPKSAKKPPVHNKIDAEVHGATAPKKRVISDSHWRTKTPQKEASKRTSPKPLPTAWVRPAVRKADTTEAKLSTPPPPLKTPIIFTSKSTGQRTRSQRQRRPSRPASSGTAERPTSSGKGSDKGTRSAGEGAAASSSPLPAAEKTELVRVRRRRAQTSPRGSLSAEDVTPGKPQTPRNSEPPASEETPAPVTVGYEPSLADSRSRDEIRERRRKGRRKVHSDVTHETLPKELTYTPRPKPRRRSSQHDRDDTPPPPESEPTAAAAPTTPPQVFESRLEAWLSSTPDPFVDADSRRRRKSKESVSTSDPACKVEKSDVGGPSEPKDARPEAAPERSDGTRRRRKRSSTLKIDTPDLEDSLSTATPTNPADNVATENGSESPVTPTLTLKRRGARRSQHSPTKDRVMSLPARKPPERHEDGMSTAPSSVEPQTREPEKLTLSPPFESPALRRLFPSTGKRLSTIVSVETFATKLPQSSSSDAPDSGGIGLNDEPTKESRVPPSEVGTQLETSTVISRKSTRRSRLASHADLISVLSMPKAGTRSIVSARSIRTNRSRLATASIDDIMSELASDEGKYMRELRTLVDGVIPVLLSCVLSKSDSAVAAGLFSRSHSAESSQVTKPIIDMGVSLERLKTLHKRVPKEDPESFLSWAQSAQRVYSDYIAAWRLGFQDVVVSLAPADDDPFTPAKVVDGPDDGAPWDEGLPRNAEGYVINSDGERVDVAYMLKRPLVRLKYLAKSIKGLNHVKPSERAERMSLVFQELVTAARKRSNDEHARLEDEAATNIDPTRARDPRSLAPLAGVRIDPNRCVRARDHFDMHLYHSSGQEVDCRVELLLRDDAPGHGTSGDVLLCEVDSTGRWLLLPPIQQSYISARNGDNKGEIVVMVRGFHADGKEWSEVLSLTTDDEHTGFEWVQMLGLNPIPPQLSEVKREQQDEKPSRPTSSHASSSFASAATGSTPPHKSRTPSPHEIGIPIGEQANALSKKWAYGTPNRKAQSRSISPITPPSPTEPPSRIDGGVIVTPQSPSHDKDDSVERTPRSLNEAMQLTGNAPPLSLKRTRAKRRSRNVAAPASRPSRQIVLDDPPEERQLIKRSFSKSKPSDKRHVAAPSSLSQSSKGYSVWMPSSEAEYSDESDDEQHSEHSAEDDHRVPALPQMHRRTSSVPTMEMPTIPKLRKSSEPTTPIRGEEDPSKISEPPASAPLKLDYAFPATEGPTSQEDADDAPPPVPPHRTPSPATPVTLKSSNTPVFTPTPSAFRIKRRSSSPLKHEYEPSTCTESSSESEEEVTEEEEEDLTSGSSDDELEDDVPTPLMPLGQLKPLPRVSPPNSVYTMPNNTITPSQSASNTPYRTVPKTSSQASKAIASIFTWSDAGRWDSLHPEDCSIVVTPGKIEVFEITAIHSKPLVADGDEIIQPGGKAPLIVVELTPLVPLRKSTAIDISIRSPPTAESRIKSGNNIMLRSRNAQECAQLYAMINHSRINNPTYIALQNARGPYGQSSWAEAMDRQNAARSNSGSGNGWFAGTLGRRSSYRKTSTRAASISAATESSVGTMNTALRSALGRFSFGKNKRFNIRGSTLGSRSTNSFDTGSSGSGTGSPQDPHRAPGAPAGITNTKCRLYERDSLTKWRDMGAARLTIMLPDRSTPASTMREGKGSPGLRDITQEKRIVVVGKTKGETLLDVTLSESCFERVARSGIAVSVWEDLVGVDGVAGRAAVTGGVSGARARVFMIQMKSERECAYSFSLLGKLRY